jgi:hypothetical protein
VSLPANRDGKLSHYVFLPRAPERLVWRAASLARLDRVLDTSSFGALWQSLTPQARVILTALGTSIVNSCRLRQEPWGTSEEEDIGLARGDCKNAV